MRLSSVSPTLLLHKSIHSCLNSFHIRNKYNIELFFWLKLFYFKMRFHFKISYLIYKKHTTFLLHPQIKESTWLIAMEFHRFMSSSHFKSYIIKLPRREWSFGLYLTKIKNKKTLNRKLQNAPRNHIFLYLKLCSDEVSEDREKTTSLSSLPEIRPKFLHPFLFVPCGVEWSEVVAISASELAIWLLLSATVDGRPFNKPLFSLRISGSPR